MKLCCRTLLLQTLLACWTVPTSTSTMPAELPLRTTPNLCTPQTRVFHEPPPGVDYSTNPSVFGQILRGEIPALVLEETRQLLAFQDRAPRAKLHGLIIPKAFLPNVVSLTSKDLTLLAEMQKIAHKLLQKYEPEAYKNQDFILCFHKPPFNLVDHLHLHVLAPASEMSWHYQYIKYLVGTRMCTSLEEVVLRLKLGKGPVKWEIWGA